MVEDRWLFLLVNDVHIDNVALRIIYCLGLLMVFKQTPKSFLCEN